MLIKIKGVKMVSDIIGIMKMLINHPKNFSTLLELINKAKQIIPTIPLNKKKFTIFE